MPTAFKRLTDEEYNVLNKISSKTKMDCWFWIKTDKYGVDVIYDLEEDETLSLYRGILLLCEGLDDIDIYKKCFLTKEEDEVFKNLIKKLNNILHSSTFDLIVSF